MTVKSSMGLAAWALLIMTRLATAQDSLVDNGDFNGNAAGWTITDTPGGFGYHPAVGNPPGGVQLDNVNPSPSSDPTASQTISGLTPSALYLVSGDYRQTKVRGSGLPIDQPSFGVAVDGAFLFTAQAPGGFDWQHFSFFYTASSPTALLSLSSQINGTGVSYDIDNIAMYTVPEPNCMTLGLLGWGMFLFCRRMPRRNKMESKSCGQASKLRP